MRKLISLVFLTLAAGLFAMPATASNTDYCDDVVQGAGKGLYGLCVAYYNATDSQGRERIKALYNKRRDEGDPPIEPELLDCPCFGETQFAEALEFHSVPSSMLSCELSSSGTGLDLVSFQGGTALFSVQGDGGVPGTGFPNSCIYQHFTADSLPADLQIISVDADQQADCRLLIEQTLWAPEFADVTCVSGS